MMRAARVILWGKGREGREEVRGGEEGREGVADRFRQFYSKQVMTRCTNFVRSR